MTTGQRMVWAAAYVAALRDGEGPTRAKAFAAAVVLSMEPGFDDELPDASNGVVDQYTVEMRMAP